MSFFAPDMLGIAVRIAAVLGALYLLACALLWAMQERMLFHPQPPGAESPHPAVQAVSIDRGDAVLHGWIVNEAADGPLLVYYGGNAEEVSEHLPGWADLNRPVVLFNYRGFGRSTGAPSEQALVGDAVEIARWARQRLPERPLVLFGLSLGSGIAVLAAAQTQPDAAILVSPYRSIAHIARSRFPIFPVRWLLRHPFDAQRVVGRMPATLAFASPGDRVIPFRESAAMVDALGGRATLHAFDVVHNAFLDHAPVWREVDAFLNARFGSGRNSRTSRAAETDGNPA